MVLTRDQKSTDSEGPKCRAQCGFFAASANLGFCSSCFKAVKDDYYLLAVIGANIGDVNVVTSYILVGGSVKRVLDQQEAKQLNKLGIFVPAGRNLLEEALHRDDAQIIAVLVSKMEEEEAVANGGIGGDPTPHPIASQPISKLLVTPICVVNNQPTKPPPQLLNGLPPAVGNGMAEEELKQEVEADSLLENVRLEILSTFDTRDDGLIHFWTGQPLHNNSSIGSGGVECDQRSKRQRPVSADGPAREGNTSNGGGSSSHHHLQIIGRSFALPEALQKMSWKDRQGVMEAFLEQPVMQEDIHCAIDFFPLVPGCTEFVPLYTAADLNCLLHGCFTSMAGVRDDVLVSEDPTASTIDTRTMLRDAVYKSLTQCIPLQNILVNGSESRLMELLKDASHRASLDGGHVFALANVLRRPIIVYAHQKLEGVHRESVTAPYRVSGVYLPLMWEPTAQDGLPTNNAGTVRDPVLLCYSQGHFSSLVGFTCPELVDGGEDLYLRLSVPLCDETLGPLPIHFSRASPQYCDSLSALPLPSDLQVPEDDTPLPAVEGLKDSKRHGHNPAELSLLRHYLGGVRVQPLGDGESDEDLQITTCEQRHLPRGPLGLSTLLSNTTPLPNEEGVAETNWWNYTSALWEKIEERLDAQIPQVELPN